MVSRMLIPLKITSSEAPTSAMMAIQRLGLHSTPSSTVASLMRNEKATFCRIFDTARRPRITARASLETRDGVELVKAEVVLRARSSARFELPAGGSAK